VPDLRDGRLEQTSKQPVHVGDLALAPGINRQPIQNDEAEPTIEMVFHVVHERAASAHLELFRQQHQCWHGCLALLGHDGFELCQTRSAELYLEIFVDQIRSVPRFRQRGLFHEYFRAGYGAYGCHRLRSLGIGCGSEEATRVGFADRTKV
jgi:hypothetical protein